MNDWLATSIAALLATTHLLAGRLRFLDVIPRSRWLSAAGGVAVAYVFVHVFPELAAHQRQLDEAAPLILIEQHVYLIALAGFAAFYGLERLVRRHRPQRDASGHEQIPPAVFWVHLAAFAAYNLLVGYLLLHREERSATGLITYGLAMTLHVVVNDYGLRQHHRTRYQRVGRWLLAAATLSGYAVGMAVRASDALIGVLFAALAGGVILNVIKEELPSERESRFWAFAAGAAGYAAVLMLL